MTVFTGTKIYFPEIDQVLFEGPTTDNPLAFRYYQADRLVGDRTMAEHLRFAVAYWHCFGGTGQDPFGLGTRRLLWNESADPMSRAMNKLDAAFEFFSKLGVPYYCFHDRDMAPAGQTLSASEKNLQKMVDEALERQEATGVKLLWGTANLFSHPGYMNGAATNPEFSVLASAAAQVKAAIDATVALGGENYVFWGGREGYETLLNTDMARERAHLGRFLQMARDYGRANGFDGVFLVEPKPMEPTKQQYDVDAATVIGFLREFGLADDFKLNIEANHATLAGHSFVHELQVAKDAGMLGSVDANRGDSQNGWDTDQFPTDVKEATLAMMVVLQNGGLAPGGINFDAKLRRNSTDMRDLFIAHIGAMDAFAKGLVVAHRLLEESPLVQLKKARYASFDSGDGARFERGELDLISLGALAPEEETWPLVSGQQERLENIVNDYLYFKGVS